MGFLNSYKGMHYKENFLLSWNLVLPCEGYHDLIRMMKSFTIFKSIKLCD